MQMLRFAVEENDLESVKLRLGFCQSEDGCCSTRAQMKIRKIELQSLSEAVNGRWVLVEFSCEDAAVESEM
ncbi:hypothetical protein C5167_001055 [Papaver somniferum]|uniref:Uncharacterized protein n=1 Tax=Papaver somniferum TaxID=3469 RepID=A0A4Y7KYC5_PAPSO|nr:hypothetical protein C5167_001055 [Papaver somniferum]